MDSYKENEVWVCSNCGETHEDEGEGDECCMCECDVCGSSYEDSNDADACCLCEECNGEGCGKCDDTGKAY